MSNLQILSNSIRTFENLYSLNDLHLASGGKEKHRPNQFIRLDTTKELIAEIESETPNVHAVKTIRGTQGGTYVCEELVLSYAMWISPKFHLIVLRAFMAMHKQPQQLEAPKKPRKQRGLPAMNPFNCETYEREFTARELEWLVLIWHKAYQYRELLQQLLPILEVSRSAYFESVKRLVDNADFDFDLSATVLYRITRQADVMELAPLITLEKYVH